MIPMVCLLACVPTDMHLNMSVQASLELWIQVILLPQSFGKLATVPTIVSQRTDCVFNKQWAHKGKVMCAPFVLWHRTLNELKGLAFQAGLTFGDRHAGSPAGTRRTSLAAYKTREVTLAYSALWMALHLRSWNLFTWSSGSMTLGLWADSTG